MPRIDNVEARKKLKARNEPYWVRLIAGQSLGYRKLTATSPGTWVGKYRDPSDGRREKFSLGDFSELAPSQRYDAAKAAAEARFRHLGLGGSSETVTVRQACEHYLAHLQRVKGAASAADTKGRFRRWVFSNTTFADIELSKLTARRLAAWRSELAGEAVILNRHAERPKTRSRSPGSVNRDMAALRAALNLAHDGGYITTDAAWRVALRAARNADKRRTVYLDRDQIGELIGAAPAEIVPFLRGLATLPIRPGALAALKVRDFDRRLSVISIGMDKCGHDRKIKLPPTTAAFLAKLVDKRPPEAPLFPNPKGGHWDRHAWKKLVSSAAQSAGVQAVAYTLRHSAITDLLAGGLDVLTVARLSGTSVAMIDKHYGHLRADRGAVALAGLVVP